MANQKKLHENRGNLTGLDQRGAAREELALLQWLVLCDRCGHRMSTRYCGIQRRAVHQCRPNIGSGLRWAVPTRAIDHAVATLFLDAAKPPEIELGLAVVREADARQTKSTASGCSGSSAHATTLEFLGSLGAHGRRAPDCQRARPRTDVRGRSDAPRRAARPRRGPRRKRSSPPALRSSGRRIRVYNEDVQHNLLVLAEVIAPVLGEAIRATRGTPLRPIISRALHLGGELHSRNTAATPTAFPLQDYQGGSPERMVEMTRAMYEITLGERPEFKLPASTRSWQQASRT